MEHLRKNNKKILAKDEDQGAHTLLTRVGGTPPRARPLLVAPLDALRRPLQLYIFAFGEKKSERRNDRVLRYGAAAKP